MGALQVLHQMDSVPFVDDRPDSAPVALVVLLLRCSGRVREIHTALPNLDVVNIRVASEAAFDCCFDERCASASDEDGGFGCGLVSSNIDQFDGGRFA